LGKIELIGGGIDLKFREILAKYLIKTSKSREMFEEVSAYIPGAVGSAIQFFRPYPIFAQRGYGSKIWDVDGNEYIDHCMSYGAMVAGHRNPEIVEAIVNAVKEYGTLLGAPHPLVGELAKEISSRIPDVEMIRFTNSGGEATMYAIRLARAVTGREKIVKMEGAYHGAHDYLLISDKPSTIQVLGSYEEPRSVPDSLGTPQDVTKLTLTAHFNDIDSVERLFKRYGNEIAAVITEPVQTNMGVVLPEEGYLKELRRLCDYYGALLIFDEVKTGFNAAPSASYLEYGVRADLVTLGKNIGGGTPLAAFGGRREFMEQITPMGRAVHYGTYNANPLCVAAGLAALNKVFTPDTHDRMKAFNNELVRGINEAIQESKIVATTVVKGNMGAIYFGLDKPPKNFREVYKADKNAWYKYWIAMLVEGIIPYGGAWFEEWFVSAMHSREDIEKTVEAYHKVLKIIQE
jgi:glutamate-1-semialdehyde 2,1-aminomutase